jgi:hypothetical protein
MKVRMYFHVARMYVLHVHVHTHTYTRIHTHIHTYIHTQGDPSDEEEKVEKKPKKSKSSAIAEKATAVNDILANSNAGIRDPGVLPVAGADT